MSIFPGEARAPGSGAVYCSSSQLLLNLALEAPQKLERQGSCSFYLICVFCLGAILMFLPGSIHVPVISRLFSLTKARTCLGNLVVQYIIHCKKPVVREKRKDMIMCTVVKTPKWFDIFGVTDVFLLLLQLSLLVSEAVSHTRVLTEGLETGMPVQNISRTTRLFCVDVYWILKGKGNS